ncbi:ATP-dependent helicase [Pedobacter sp. MC2016-24]|uniref:ATP-dependent helicase n=1 Tax=Pedobacter sp. MC2016-24 TaxID=2780090 RepID=UPI00187E19A2|nr:ATP-dependent helicase [Pedobacter sp. MC2016-24]MBE9603141.1 ATP-dependent helicase [Pedobacter sp. MC2016-24]
MKVNPHKPSAISLSKTQEDAINSEGKRILVLAVAGSGKTETLLHKINHLIERKGAVPSSILAITFSHNAANEIIDRLILKADKTGKYQEILNDATNVDEERIAYKKKHKWIDRLTIKTFHSFCYNVLRNSGVNEFDNQFKIITNKKYNSNDELSANKAGEFVSEAIQKLLSNLSEDIDFLLQLKRYILDYYVDVSYEERETAINNHDKKYTSLNGTRVRSKSEQFIADWLYRRNIKFEYEPKLSITTKFAFHPDFFITEANLYLEHVSNLSHPIANKEREFKQSDLLFVKTDESITRDTAVFNHALDKIIKNRLPTGYKDTPSLNFNEELGGYHNHLHRFIDKIILVSDRIKVYNLELDKVLENGQNDQHERVRSFYQLAGPIIKAYLDYCIDKSYLDFNDLISRSISLFKNYPDALNKYKSQFQHILVDEFQDVNALQVELINLLITPQTQLFCVGDDWQSIYAFRGANVDYTINFDQHFPNAELIKLDTNYRSTQHIVQASNDVIRNNKNKVDKSIESSKQSDDKVIVFSGSCEDESVEFCANKILDLLSNGLKNDDILFLFRNNKMAETYRSFFKEQRIAVSFRTIHSAKGLQAKVVFILGLTEGKGGFPYIRLDDRILNVIKMANHDLLLEEERRVFYVSITRAKDQLFLITEKGNESSFIREISPEAIDRMF